MRTTFTLALLSTAVVVEAAIKTTGLWTGKDHTSKSFTFTNGIPTSSNAETQRRMTSAHALPESMMSNYESKSNVA